MPNKIRLTGGLEVGTLVLDARRDRVGRVMDFSGGYVQLRPPAGGYEWDCARDDIAPIDESRLLSPAAVADRTTR